MKIKAVLLSLFFCLFLLTTCSPQRPVEYPLPNPVLVAFHHQLDVAGWRDAIQKDSTTSITTVDGGILLFSDAMEAPYRFWVNDSLLVVQWNATYSLPLIGVGDQAIFAAQRRISNTDLVDRTREDLLSAGFRFSISPVNTDYYSSAVTIDPSSFLITKDQLQPVDSLTWHSSAFTKQATYQFVDGYLHGPFTTLNSLGLSQKGRFQYGTEVETWEYRDTSGKLQYTEEYALGGELQKVTHEKGATYFREKPLPTLLYLWRIHWMMFGLLCLLGGYVLFRYLSSLLQFKRPYQGQSIGEIFLSSIIVSPILGLGAGFLALISTMVISSGLRPLAGWDLPLHFLDVLQGLLIFPIIECGWLWITNRFADVLWHSAIATLAILILGEWHFLTQLEKFV